MRYKKIKIMDNLRKPFILCKHSKALADKNLSEQARLDKIVENSSEKNRNFFIAYLGLLIYVQAIIFSTTDLQLLVSTDGLKLPLIDLSVPLVRFYVFVPIFIVALHFNFLQNLDSHHYKLMHWQALHPGGKVPRKFIFPFLFDFAILEQGSQFQWLVKFANSLLCYNFAPITLGLLLIRFSDRQDWLVTVWHYFAFVLDCGLVWRFHRGLQMNQKSQSQTEKKKDDKSILKRLITKILSPLNKLLSGSAFLLWGFWYGIKQLYGVLVLVELLITLAVAMTSDDFFVKRVQPWLQSFTKLDVFAEAPDWGDILRQAMAYPIEWFLPRINIDPNETVWHINRPELENLAKLAGYEDWLKYFQEQGLGFRPETINLKFLRIPGQRLPRADFRGAKMQGADLSFAEIKGGSLISANLHGANLIGINLENAYLSGLNIQNAELRNANLSFAYLSSAVLQGTDLSSANISRVNLSYANLIGADLTQTKAHSADFSFAFFQGSNLTYAQLQGSNLHAANLTGTSLHTTLLLGADLTYAKMVGTDLTNTQMTGAIFDTTDLRGASPFTDGWSGYFIVQDYGYQIEESSGGTAISGGTFGIPLRHIAVTKNPVEKKKLDWKRIKQFGEHILNPKLKNDYENHIAWAEQRFNSVKEPPKFKHFPSGLARQVIEQLCRSPDSLFAIMGVRQNYLNLEHRLIAYEGYSQAKDNVSQIPEAKFVIEDIERQLCALDDCAGIRNKIGGMSCTSFKKKTANR
jgi:uncharacterized protein YjbI with pentapeptide repeats